MRAYDEELRSEELLGEMATDRTGRYEITYTTQQLCRAEKGSADLRVGAYDESGQLLASSPVIFNAGSEETVDLVLEAKGAVPSEYERLLRELQPTLGGVPLHELTEQDLDFLAGDTGLERTRIAWLVESVRLARDDAGPARRRHGKRAAATATGGTPNGGLPPEVFYAWLSQGLPADPRALWSRPADDLMAALRNAIDGNLVPAGLRDRLDGIGEDVKRRSVAAVLQPAPGGTPASLGDLLDTLRQPLGPQKRDAVARVVGAAAGRDGDLVARLEEAGLTHRQAINVQRTLRLGELTMGHAPLVRDLQDLSRRDGDGSLRPLAALGRDRWLDLAFAHGAPAGSGLAEEAYARELESRVEAMHPTAALAARLDDEVLAVERPGFADVKTFLESNPDFDVASSNLETFTAEARFEGIQDREAVVTVLCALQRMKKLSATWEEAGALIDAGLDSALDVAHLGRDRLRRRLAGRLEPERAEVIFRNAEAMHDMSLALMVNALPRFAAGGTAALPRWPDDIDVSVLDERPTLRRLFGDLDYCECRHCRSVLSPAAYFVDLLEFLKRSPGALERLLACRPDLAELELSCANTETELPVIDLVLEILENAVALPLTVELPDGMDGAAALATTPLPTPVTDTLARTTLDLGDGLKAAKEPRQLLIGTMTQWTVTDRHRRWTLNHFPGGFYARRPFPLPPERMPLEGLDVDRFLDGLDNGEVIDAAKGRFEALLAPALRRLRLSGYRISPLEPGRRWKVTYRLGAILVLTEDTTGGTLEFRTASDDVILTRNYSLPAIDATRRALVDGSIGGVLGGHLPLDRPYVVAPHPNPARAGWTLETREEELELQYQPDRLTVAALTYQSSSQREELTAFPENRNPAAYDRLTTANFPWSLPFHLPLVELRAYLARARSSRRKLMELCMPTRRLSDGAIAREVLGLCPEGARLITTTAAVPELWAYWGLELGGDGRARLHDASDGTELTDEPLRLLSGRISLVMQQARLSHGELLDVLETRFLSAAGGQPPTITPVEECRPSRMRLEGLTAAHLDRIHRFVRLRRALGWEVRELDLALAAVQPDGSDLEEVLARLSHLKRLQELLGLRMEVLASWWGGLGGPVYHDHSGAGQPEITPLYERVFLASLLHQPPDPDLRLNADRSGLVPTAAGKTINAKATLVAAALGIRQDDLTRLVGTASGVPDALTLANLSQLHRITTLSKALALPVEDYLAVRSLTGIDPFATTASAIEFCEAATVVRESGFTIEELLYLLRHEPRPGAQATLGEQRAIQILTVMRAAVQAKRRQVDDASYAGDMQRLYTELEPVLGDVAVEQVTELFGISREVAHELLRRRLRHPADAARPAVDVFGDPAFVESDADAPPSATDVPHAFTLVHRLHKISMLCSRLELEATELAWLADPRDAPDAMASLDLNALPVALVTGATTLFAGWRQLVVLVRLRDRAPGGGAMLTGYVAAVARSDLEAARAVLADAFSIPAADLASVAPTLFGSAADYRDPLRLSKLVELIIEAKRLGASLEQVTAMARPNPSFEQAAESAAVARGLLRAKHGGEHWPELITPVSNELRGKQRDALVDYLLARDRARDAADLYERYLIDVQMAPCMMTTRLLQGIAAVQLFVQRCLFNLERDVPPDGIDSRLWEWMKSYRVWEANRKVFLYPENWLAPELRDDKTQTFRTLERALSQDEPSHDHAKEALLAYVDELNELAQLSVVGMWDEQGTGNAGERALYVVGRSPNQPYRYFWRRCVDFGASGMQWTGWERIDLDISGDHVVPFVLEGDLHVAWPIIRKREQEGELDRWELELAWARRTSRGWSQKKVSKKPHSVVVVPGKDEAGSLTFRATRITLGEDDYGDPAATAPTTNRRPTRELIRIVCYRAADPFGGQPITPAPPWRATGNRGQPADRSKVPLTLDVFAYRRYTQDGSYRPWDSVDVALEYQVLNQTRQERLGTTGANGRATETYYLSYDQSDRSYQLVAEGPGNPPVRGTIELPGGLTSYQVSAYFVTQTNEDPPPRVGPDTPVEMVPSARFELRSGDDLALRQGGGQSLPLVDGSYSYATGFQETSGRGDDALKLPPGPSGRTIFAATPDQFFTVPAQSDEGEAPVIWYYRDGHGRYFQRIDGGSPMVLSDLPPALVGELKARSYDLSRLLGGPTQRLTDRGERFRRHNPVPALSTSASITEESFSFAPRAPHGLYGWELFFHAPLLIGEFFSKQQRFGDAQRWLHFIFDPTIQEAEAGAAGFWRFLPFRRGVATPVAQLLAWLTNPDVDSQEKRDVRDSISLWKRDPFRPHAVARLRPVAYQRRTMFTYLDNLLDWGDQLFRRGTRESINDAMLLYVLAARLLGPRPRAVPQRLQAPSLTYRALAGRWDDFANAWYVFADHPLLHWWLQSADWPTLRSLGPPGGEDGTRVLTSVGTLFFCVPHNDKLLEYWNRVEDRLFKIRHCRNIDGVARDLPLFEPPIDPELLIRATAAGVDIETVLADLDAPLPRYRFSVLIQQAQSVCAELKALGAAMLSAMEKRDAEQLALLRSEHEVRLLEFVRDVREQQAEEARKNLDALREGRRLTAERYRQYQRLLGKTDIVIPAEGQATPPETLSLRLAQGLRPEEQGLGLIRSEQDQLARLIEAQILSLAAGILGSGSSVAFAAGATYDPTHQTYKTAQSIGHGTNAFATALNTLAGYTSAFATRDALFAGYERRRDEWAFQSNLAARELQQIDKQIIAAQLRIAIAEGELQNHDKQTDQARAVGDFMKEKYTNKELYSWHVGQLSDLYFRTYQLAYDAAKRAARAFEYELGIEHGKSGFIRFGYWDSLHSGLLVGERLSHDLKRVELAYLERNRRDYEITKHVSLVLHDPMALVTLKQTGRCQVSLPEALFDLDYPGQYLRRIKSVALTVPCVTGPYTSINCTLTLLTNRIRARSSPAEPYPEQPNGDQPHGRFLYDFAPIQSIATSHGQNDRGTFELNFRDERYLPFEGAGAISTWRIELPRETNAFDLDTIADVVLRIDYTARDGRDRLWTAALQAAVLPAPTDQPGPAAAPATFPAQRNLRRMFSLRHEFALEWNRFLHPAAESGRHTMEFRLTPERFPYQLRGRNLAIERVDLFLRLRDGTVVVGGQPRSFLELFGDREVEVELTPPNAMSPESSAAGDNQSLKSAPDFLSGLPYGLILLGSPVRVASNGMWRLEIDAQRLRTADLHAALRNSVTVGGSAFHYLKPEVVEDLIVICHYQSD